MCNSCGFNNCDCLPCLDCLEPESYVVRKVELPDFCESSVKDLIEATKPSLRCRVAFGNPIVLGDSVTLVESGGVASAEYSKDNGISWQSSPTFSGLNSGTHKFLIRERDFRACVASGLVNINQGGCKPDWKNTTNPPTTQCISGTVHNIQSDGCGNTRPIDTGVACCLTPVLPDSNILVYPASCNGSLVLNNASLAITGIQNGSKYGISKGTTYTGPNYANAIPFTGSTLNISNLEGSPTSSNFVLKIFGYSDSCSIEKAIVTPGTICSCVTPIFSGTPVVVPSSCASNSFANNGSFILAGFQHVDKYGISFGPTYTGPNYQGADPITFSIGRTGIAGSSNPQSAIVRLFNGSDVCRLDIPIVIPASSCGCFTPEFQFSIQNPTCAGTATNQNGILKIAATIGNRFQVVQDSTFTATPNYAGATVIPNSNPLNIVLNVGFFADQPHKDYTVRVYNNSQTCFLDKTYRFINPCFSNCTPPSHTGVVAAPATCSGAVIQNNASIGLENVTNVTRYGYSLGSTYTGPDYAGAVVLTGGDDINIIGLPGAATISQAVIRTFNGNNECRSDVLINIPASICCTLPTFNIPVVVQATCSGNTVQNNAGVQISGIQNGTRFGYSIGTSYTGPAYAGATPITGSSININGLPGIAGATNITIRIFNGTNECQVTTQQTIPGRTCACVQPAFTLQFTNPTCAGDGNSNLNGVLRITSHSNGTKYQVSQGAVFNGIPNYEVAETVPGPGAFNWASDIWLDNLTPFMDYTVRMYNGNINCFTDHTVRATNPCYLCCGLTINSVTLTNV